MSGLLARRCCLGWQGSLEERVRCCQLPLSETSKRSGLEFRQVESRKLILGVVEWERHDDDIPANPVWLFKPPCNDTFVGQPRAKLMTINPFWTWIQCLSEVARDVLTG